VCICTFKRPHVQKTVLSVLAQRGLPGVVVEILVCDDDPAGSAWPVVEPLQRAEPHVVRYLLSGSANVARARNLCLESARGEWIAFIDDDEIADPGWLRGLLDVQQGTGADVVKGRVSAVYPPGAEAWIAAADPFTRDYGEDGAVLTKAATGNVLIRRTIVEKAGLTFDEGYGKTGGEDVDFFRRLAGLDVRMVSARRAVVHEIVPPERVELSYFRRRYRQIGRNASRIQRGGRAFSRVKDGLVSVAGVLAWPLFKVVPLKRGKLHFRLLLKYNYSIGYLGGLLDPSDAA
jgi:succinoglycan biosynthesis protein ExoM